MLTGISADRWLLNKRFLMILILNVLLYVMDIYLFASASSSSTKQLQTAGNRTFSTFLGAILCSSDLIYLILMPMFIAKTHSDKISQLTNLRKYDNPEIKTGANMTQTSMGQLS